MSVPCAQSMIDIGGSGLSWSGFNVYGDSKSIDEVRRLQNCEERMNYLQSYLKTIVENCASAALEQRCERGTPWDLACTTIAEKIREIKV